MNININSYIDHTALKANLAKQDIYQLAAEALEYKFASICINPAYIHFVRETREFDDLAIATVLDFPLGNDLQQNRQYNLLSYLEYIQEIDIVIPLHHIANNDYERLFEEEKALLNLCPDHIISKAIIEYSLWTMLQVQDIVLTCAKLGYHYIKTSTGIIQARHTMVEDILHIREILDSAQYHHIKVKASGGIRNRDQALALIEAGAHRLGTSASISLLE